MRIIKPPKLNIGDRVGIISPSQPITNRKHYNRSINTLKNLGFEVVLGKHVFRSHGYAAGFPEERAEDLNSMFADPKIKAIFCSAGGYVSLHLLPLLNYSLIKKNPKVFSGFSDITILLNAIFKNTGLVTFYNFSVERFHEKASDFTIKSFLNLFISETPRLSLPQKSRWRIIKKGEAQGRLIGGNLETFTNNLILDQYAVNPAIDKGDYILFFEEHGTDIESLDKALHTLYLAKVFDNLKGVIIGKITDVGSRNETIKNIRFSKDLEFKNKPRPKNLTLNQFLLNKFEEFGVKIPVVANVDFGYVRDQITMPIGAKVYMNLNKKEPIIKLINSPFRSN
ncbi:MAG: LD-carboxypeptidase [Patescibacteria group bacterium]